MKAEYDLIASQWQAMRTTLPKPDQALFRCFLNQLPQESAILDLGCGTGTPVAQLLIENGHRITGVDRSKKLLAVAQERFPLHQWHLQDLESFNTNHTYNGVVIWDSLFHLPREQHLPLLIKAYQALSPEGLLILSSGGSDTNIAPFTGVMFDVEFFYDAYPVAELITLCESIGFTVIDKKMVNLPDGKKDKGRLGLVMKKTG